MPTLPGKFLGQTAVYCGHATGKRGAGASVRVETVLTAVTLARVSMPLQSSYDAVVVGSGPNGLAAAIRLAQEKVSVLVVEAAKEIGGGARSGELTLPGYVHDICSAVFPLAVASPFFRRLPLSRYGLSWIHPELALAHPFDGGGAIGVANSVDVTASQLGDDGASYRKLLDPVLREWGRLVPELLRPLLGFPRHPLVLARFAMLGLRSAEGLARARFKGIPARALFCGLAAHSFLPLGRPGTGAFGLVLAGCAHGGGWPFAAGGAQALSNALAAHFRDLGGEIATGFEVKHLQELPPCKAALLDVTPRQFLALASGELPASYAQRLQRYRHGPGVFKIDYALDAAVPWTSAECRRAGTVHLGGTMEEVSAAEEAVAGGQHAERPFVLLAQPTLFDRGRSPQGKHIAWAYCHVPRSSTMDMTSAIEGQIERFAPGFRARILARRTVNCGELENHNPNFVGGDISGGANDLMQLFGRPALSLNPYRTAIPGVYLCSSSTPPGGGVHGMCGYHAAVTALRDCFSRQE